MLHPFKDWSQEVIYEGASFHEKNNPIKLGAQPGPVAIKIIKTYCHICINMSSGLFSAGTFSFLNKYNNVCTVL